MTRLKWNLVLVHLEIVLVLVQDRCMVCSKQVHGLFQTRLGNHFSLHPIELLGDEAQVESRFGPFGDSVSISAR